MLMPLLLPLALTAALNRAPVPQLEPVVSVASRSTQPAREVAGTVSVLDRERMDQTLVRDLADAVRYEPGVSAPEDATRFGISGFAIRGLSDNRVGMQIDGVPVADGFAIGSFSNATRGAIETSFLSRMEILRGPASTLYGSDALAGVVSLRTLTPAELLADGNGQLGGRVQTQALGRDGSVAQSGLSAWQSGALNVLAGVVSRHGHERDNQPRTGGLASNPADRAERSELLKLGYDTAHWGQWGLSADRSREQVRTDVQSLVHGPSQYASTSQMLGDDQYRRERISVHNELRLDAPGAQTVRVLIYQQHTRAAQGTTQIREAVAPRTPATLRERDFLFKTAVLGLDLQGEGRFEALGAAHWQVLGLEVARTNLTELRDARETNLATGAVTNVLIGERFPVRDFPNSLATELGVFWQDEIRLGHGALTLIPGARYEHYGVDARLDSIFQADNPDFQPADLSESQITPKLGLRYEWSHDTQLFAQYALGFRAPPMADVNIGFTIPAFNYVAIPNPDLQPEHSRGWELGVRHHREYASLEVVGFDNHYRDLIESRVNIGRDASGALVFQSINRAAAHLYGVEMRAESALPWDGLSLNAALAYTRGDDTARQLPLNSVEPARLTLGLVYDSQDGNQRLELVATAVARKTRIDTSTLTPFQTPGYATLDAFWRIQAGARLQVDLGLYNLADRRYWLWSGVRGLPADAREIDLYSQPGRQFGASVRYLW